MTEHTSAINVGSLNKKQVLVVFTNGMTCEGKVLLWGDERSVLFDEKSGNLLYIYNTKDNVMMVKVAVEKEQSRDVLDDSLLFDNPVHNRWHEAECVESWVEGVDYVNNVQTEVTPFPSEPTVELDHHEPDQDLRLKKLVELKRMKTQAMKDVMSKRLRTFIASGESVPDYYDTPHFKK